MGAKYTEAQKKASLNYQKAKAQIKITVSKEAHSKYHEHAKEKGVTLTALIIQLLEKDMQ